MTLERDAITADLFGLAATFPRPGWVVLDAARDHRFTGELVFDTTPEVRVYMDRGQMYLAERAGDALIGARLVDAEALTATQLDHGSIRIGAGEHIGRLFERAPSVNRHVVLVTLEMLTEECLGWLASQRVSSVEATPYRHHSSGLHQWDRPFGAIDLTPGDPLPAPAPTEQPIVLRSPERLFSPVDGFDADEMIQWDEQSWLDERLPERGGQTSPDPFASDWIDRLQTHGLPEPGADPLASIPAQMPHLSVDPVDRFEVVWPSGEIDEQFGVTDSIVDDVTDHVRDQDRGGPTARVARPSDEITTPEEPVQLDSSDGLVLAVRRAVASVELGSLVARRRLVEDPANDLANDLSSDLAQPVPPGRVAVRSEHSEWAPSPVTPTRSVFETVTASIAGGHTVEVVAASGVSTTSLDDSSDRTTALRRLIGTLRRR